MGDKFNVIFYQSTNKLMLHTSSFSILSDDGLFQNDAST